MSESLKSASGGESQEQKKSPTTWPPISPGHNEQGEPFIIEEVLLSEAGQASLQHFETLLDSFADIANGLRGLMFDPEQFKTPESRFGQRLVGRQGSEGLMRPETIAAFDALPMIADLVRFVNQESNRGAKENARFYFLITRLYQALIRAELLSGTFDPRHPKWEKRAEKTMLRQDLSPKDLYLPDRLDNSHRR